MQTVEEHPVKVVLSDSSMSGFEPNSEPLSLFWVCSVATQKYECF